VTAAIVARGGSDETRRLLAVASNLKVRTLRSLGYGCGLRASEVVRLKVKHIDSRIRPEGGISYVDARCSGLDLGRPYAR
jgi:integrase